MIFGPFAESIMKVNHDNSTGWTVELPYDAASVTQSVFELVHGRFEHLVHVNDCEDGK